jgi:hypothetical protein
MLVAGRPARVRFAAAALSVLIGACAPSPAVTTPPPGGPTGQPTLSPSPGVPTATPTPSTPSPLLGLLLNEVRFAPAAGDAAFVEISNSTSTQIDATGARLRVDGKDFPLSEGSLPVAPGSQVVVSFDTPDSTDHPGIRAPSGFALAPEGSTVELLDGSGRGLDRVAWGGGQAGAVSLGPSDVPGKIDPGTTIGRPPGANHPYLPTDWVVYPPALASPGRPNPTP